MDRVIVSSSRNVFQWFVLLTPICAGLAFTAFGALAGPADGPLNPPHAILVSKNEITGNFGEAFGRRLDTEGAVVLMQESGANDQ